MAQAEQKQMAKAVAEIRQKIDAAAREAGRRPEEVLLCAACKTRTVETVQESAALPIDLFGENHVQELTRNFDAGAYQGKPAHLIGHLQTNKIKKVLGRAALIQSVDSVHLLEEIAAQAEKLGIRQDVLLEINIGGEKSKTGMSPDTLWPLLEAASKQHSVHVKGLMAIPPVNTDNGTNRAFFAQMRELAEKAAARHYENVEMGVLSMGMSDDYENAVREGATIVRIGTAIYGARDYGSKA